MAHSILVTGATGFVGSHVLEELIQIGHQDLHIIAACRDRRNLISDFNGEVREGDLRDPEYLDRVLAGADIVVVGIMSALLLSGAIWAFNRQE